MTTQTEGNGVVSPADVRIDDLSHRLRPDPDSAGPRGYRRQARRPVSPAALGLITVWAGRHWGQA